MSTDDTEFAKVTENYSKMLKIFRDHLKKCPTFQKQVMEEIELDG
jgi:hypothetical protein